MTVGIHSTRRAFLAGAAATGALAAASPAFAAAPMQGVFHGGYRRFKLGGFEVTTLLDGAVPREGPHPIFAGDLDKSVVDELMVENGLPTDNVTFYFHPTVVNTGSEVVLFDAGNAQNPQSPVGNTAMRLKESGIDPDQVDVVVLTHFHPDHIGGLVTNGEPVYKNARYVAGTVEYDFWSAEDRMAGPTERVAKLTASNVVPFAEKMTFIGDEGSVVSGITGLNSFGHTPGHMVYHIESEGRRLMITGDIGNHYVIALQKPDWAFGFDADKPAAAATRKKIFGMIAADKIPFIGYHMPYPGIGFIEPAGDAFQYVPATYQLDY